MVEEDRVLPFDFGVAGGAVVAERTFMWFVVAVAGIARGAGFFLEDGLDVASVAFCFAVPPRNTKSVSVS